MLVTDVHQERSITRITQLDKATPADIEAMFREIEDKALADLLREKFPRETLSIVRQAGMRYGGQSYEVAVPVSAINGQDDIEALKQAFHAAHERRYGHKATNETIEIVNFKVTAIGSIPKPVLKKAVPGGRAAEPVEYRQAFFGGDDSVETPVFDAVTSIPARQSTGRRSSTRRPRQW